MNKTLFISIFCLAAILSFRGASAESLFSQKTQSSWLYPIAGVVTVVGPWSGTLQPQYLAGLGLELGASDYVAVEAEGSLSPNRLRLGVDRHSFTQYNLSTGLKLYPFPELRIRPFVIAGLAAVYFEDLPSPSKGPYNHFQGSGFIGAGGEFAISDSVELGFRGVFWRPWIGLPEAKTVSGYAVRGYEADSAIQVDTIRFLASLKMRI